MLSWKLLIVELGVSTLPSQKQHKDSLAENPASSHYAKPCLCHVGDHLGVMPDNFCQVSEERMTAFAAHVGVDDLDHAFDLEAEATEGDADVKQPTKPFPLPQTYRSIFSGQSSTSCCLYKRLL